MKKLYRAPLDYLEEVTTGMADTVFVNSGFTKEVTTRFFFAYRDVLVPSVVEPEP
jgi:alpha-1,3/alpha-1,6-mannosyltransferase